MARSGSAKLLSAAASTGAGTVEFESSKFNAFTFHAKGAGTAVLSFAIEVYDSEQAEWFQIHTDSFSADGEKVIQYNGAIQKVRGNVTARTTGNLTLSVQAQGPN